MKFVTSMAHARDRALEGAVFSFLDRLAGEYVELERSGVHFDFSRGTARFAHMEFKAAAKALVNQELAAAGLKLRWAHGALHHMEMTNFFPQDVLDGDFDYPISAHVKGLVIVLEPTEELGETAEEVAATAEDESAEDDETEPDTLLETFLQGFGSIEITQIHVRYQDPRNKINVALNIGMGAYGSVKLWEPEDAPQSFRSVDKQNEGKAKPLQDVMKQFFFPFPSIEINSHADRMINADYNFEPQAKACAVIQEGSLFTCSMALDSRNLGQDVTIYDPQLRAPLVFHLSRDQIQTVLDVAQHLLPEQLTKDVLVGADVLDQLAITVGKKQLHHFFLDPYLAAEETARAEAKNGMAATPGSFFLDRTTRIKVDTHPVHSEASFQAATEKSFRKRPIQQRLTAATTTISDKVRTATTTLPLQSKQVKVPPSSTTTTPTKKKTIWQRIKTFGKKGDSRDASVPVNNSHPNNDNSNASTDDSAEVATPLGENNATVDGVQLKQSWGTTFKGLEISLPFKKPTA